MLSNSIPTGIVILVCVILVCAILFNFSAWIQKKTKPMLKKYHQLLSVHRERIFFSLILSIWAGLAIYFYHKHKNTQELLDSLTRTLTCETREEFLSECMRLHEITLSNEQRCLANHKQCVDEQKQFTDTLENCTNTLGNQLQKEQNRLIQFKEIETGWLTERATLIRDLTDCLDASGTSESRSE